MGKIKEGKLFYHLTKLSNLDSIIEKGLMSRKILENIGANFEDIADPSIMNKRKFFGLDKYIPFHFHPYSSFDVAVKNNYNEEFVYICIRRSLAEKNKFCILPKHPLSIDEVNIFEYNEGMDKIDWEAMEQSSTFSEYCKNVRMAECLTESIVTTEDFHSIAVKNIEIQQIVEEKLKKAKGKKPYVDVVKWLDV